ncbi:hypothetical protein SM033_00006 [Vibrio phage vB_VpaM_sm033]|nr:hypothetical protein SM033_00006 [Vibrio phage vB_VpaM_sm033]
MKHLNSETLNYIGEKFSGLEIIEDFKHECGFMITPEVKAMLNALDSLQLHTDITAMEIAEFLVDHQECSLRDNNKFDPDFGLLLNFASCENTFRIRLGALHSYRNRNRILAEPTPEDCGMTKVLGLGEYLVDEELNVVDADWFMQDLDSHDEIMVTVTIAEEEL